MDSMSTSVKLDLQPIPVYVYVYIPTYFKDKVRADAEDFRNISISALQRSTSAQ
jgi:hypothetical protein